MKALQIVGIVALVYVGIVVLFESSIGYFQPRGQGTLVIATRADNGAARQRVVSRLDSDGRLYVAANHWPRNWYNRALANPDIDVLWAGKKAAYRAVPVVDTQRKRVASKYDLPLAIRVLTGFPPRQFLRLDPRQASAR